MLIRNVDTSVPEGRRYGEPDWERRPVAPLDNGLLGNQNLLPQYQPEFPKYTEQSYEEWKLEGLIKW
jgi:hypothetical protein